MKKLNLILLILLVIGAQYYLLGDSLTLGFKPDDWNLYFGYKMLGFNPLSKILSVWSERGMYTTYQVYYMGLLESLGGFNYQVFHQINLIFKILATLSIYPLILILFKRQLLAVLAVIFYSISASTVGSLEFTVKGSDYLAIFWMNLFLFVYYLIIIDKLVGLKYYFLLFFLFILSLAFSPIRIFPLIVIPPLVETFLVLRMFDYTVMKKSSIRLAVLYLPFLMLFLYSPVSVLGDAQGSIGVLKVILGGNWFNILSSLSGIGYLFVTNDYWGKIFGSILANNFENYLYFLLGGPTVILGFVTLLLVWAKIPRLKVVFLTVTTLLNFVFQVLIFFVAFHHLNVPTFPKANYDPTNLYSVIFGGYIFIIGFMVFLYWLKEERKDRIKGALWIGSAFSFIFTFLTWLFAPTGTGFSATSYYLVVASMGSSLLMAAFLVVIYDKLKSGRLPLLAFLPFLILIPIFVMNMQEIHQRFSGLNNDGRGATGQIIMQEEARRVLKDIKAGDSILVYIDTSDITNGPFYSEGFLTSFPFFMHFKEGKLIDGCIGMIYEDAKIVELRKIFRVQDEIVGFEYPLLCVDGAKGRFKRLFLTTDQFYAFKISDKKLIDIKHRVINQLNSD